MIDPPKATKGRRMSKESRKKSSKASAPAKAAKKPEIKPGAKPKPQVKANTKTAPGKTGTDKATTVSRTLASSKPAAKQVKSSRAATAASESGTGAAVPAAGLKPQDPAPDFALPRDGGGTVSLADYRGRKLVLFFYPRANTPGCTKEAIDFTRLAGAFADSGTAVLGVSADTVKAQDSFRDKHKLAIPLISDERHQMLEAYGAWGEKSLYGRKFMGIIRSTVLIGSDGRIARIWRNVKVDGHADAVLAAAREL
jgi:thioredoxin-dependent peroxiredoxin